jgi:hypothetical protein
MSPWQDIVMTALLGTGRQGVPAAADDMPIGAFLRRISEPGSPVDASGNPPATSREWTLLSAAAAASLYERAGRLPAIDDRKLEPAGPEQLPRCSARAAEHLSQLLTGGWRDLLPEWLEAAAAAGLRVPEARLPALLELGRAHADLRPLLLPVIGARGRWLASLNPEWRYARDALQPLATEMLESLPRSSQAELLAKLSPEGTPLRSDDPALALLAGYGRPWSLELSRAVLGLFRHHIASNPSIPDWRLRSMLKQFARLMAPEMHLEAGAGWALESGDGSGWAPAVQELRTVLRLRYEMLEALSSIQ